MRVIHSAFSKAAEVCEALPGTGRKRKREDSHSVLLSMSSRKWDRGEGLPHDPEYPERGFYYFSNNLRQRNRAALGLNHFQAQRRVFLHHHDRQRRCINTCAFLFIAASLGKRLYRAPLMIPLWDVRKIEQAALSRDLEIPGRQSFRFSRRRKKEESLHVRHAPVSRCDVTEKAFSR